MEVSMKERDIKTLAFECPTKLAEELKNAAKEEMTSSSTLIRKAIKEYLDKYYKNNE